MLTALISILKYLHLGWAYGLEIRQENLDALAPNQLIDDTIIHGYINKAIHDYPNGTERCLIFDCFSLIKLESNINYDLPQIRGRNPLTFSTCLFPFNPPGHWVMYSITWQGSSWLISIWDSMGGHTQTKQFDILKAFIARVWNSRRSDPLPAINKNRAICSQQNDYTSCGLFLMNNLRLMIKDPTIPRRLACCQAVCTPPASRDDFLYDLMCNIR